jgi:hypothetical protein
VNPPEQIAHKAIADHLRLRATPGVLWWHTPNNIFAGGKRNRKGVAIQASIMKGLGMRAGVPDFLLVRDGKLFALELKREYGGRLSEARSNPSATAQKPPASSSAARNLHCAPLRFLRAGAS